LCFKALFSSWFQFVRPRSPCGKGIVTAFPDLMEKYVDKVVELIIPTDASKFISVVGRCSLTLLRPRTDPVSFQRLKPQHEKLQLSNLAFECNLRHYSKVGDAVLNGVSAAGTAAAADAADAAAEAAAGFGLSSKSFRSSESSKSSSREPGASRKEAKEVAPARRIWTSSAPTRSKRTSRT